MLEHETRNNPEKGPRPWIILYCRQHGKTGLVLAAPLYSDGDSELTSHVPHSSDYFDDVRRDPSGILQAGFIHLEQMRALDKARLRLDGGPLGSMKNQPFHALRGTLMGMLEPRLLPP